MFEYYAIGKESNKIHDIHKYLLALCNKKMVDKLMKTQNKQQRVSTSIEQKTRPSISYRPKEKYPTLIGAQYKYFKAQPKRKQIYLSTLQNDQSQSTPRLKANSIIQEQKIENQMNSARVIQTAYYQIERNVSTQKAEKSSKTYYLPKCDSNWITHLKGIRSRQEQQ
ncbi:unnamed protein product [Paramecium octaurelia]|uniref:Uncharacterized protein n=1 Tax=Paramecium octaurelia TaxID=43137 RepID=A0A8S1U620_PAROT|nr:unnamed protein product [Paramecium octaurelia]CAD8159472.1 unnamed protein product [Paramecium octaurelia]